MNHVVYFEIQAADPEALMSFYRDVFGWRFVEQTGLPVDYWRIEAGGIHGGLLARPARIPPTECGTNAYVCSVEVSDFDATAARIEQAGGQVALPRFAVPGVCWQGYFIDPDNNTFGIVEADLDAG